MAKPNNKPVDQTNGDSPKSPLTPLAKELRKLRGKNGHKAKPVVSKLGGELRRIREKIEASGEKMLTRRELEREVADRRGGNF
jgi:hypothetical protein